MSVFHDLRIRWRMMQRLGAYRRAREHGLADEQARAYSDQLYPPTPDDLAYEASLRDGTARPVGMVSIVRSMRAQPKHDLQKSAQQLLDEMEQLITGSQNPAFNTQLAMRALHKFAGVLAVVSLTADKHSRRLVALTVVLLVFTAALLGFTVFLYKDTHALIYHEQAAGPPPAKRP